jgi:UDP-2,3-diacylglucosamine pyrophosphatase LpxH
VHEKRQIDLVVLSDIHLGTHGCRAEELINYLRTIRPKKIILNGDIIDIWQFKKKYFPKSHLKVIRMLLDFLSKGTKIYYLPGNHDEVLRKFNGYGIKNFKISNKAVLKLNGKKAWFFHGDVFDITMKYSKWIAKLGGIGYDFLIRLNYRTNRFRALIGKEKISFSKYIKYKVKKAVKYVNQFEEIALDIARENNYDYVICGHIHQPIIRDQIVNERKITYLNSGDWIENLTSLEYNNNRWKLFEYDPNDFRHLKKERNSNIDKSTSELFESMLKNFKS